MKLKAHIILHTDFSVSCVGDLTLVPVGGVRDWVAQGVHLRSLCTDLSYQARPARRGLRMDCPMCRANFATIFAIYPSFFLLKVISKYFYFPPSIDFIYRRTFNIKTFFHHISKYRIYFRKDIVKTPTWEVTSYISGNFHPL